MACELDAAPDLLIRRLLLEPVELTLQALELAGHARPAQQPRASQLAQPLAQPQLGLTRHLRTTSRVWPRWSAAPNAARPRLCDRSDSWIRRARNRREVSRASSAARLAGRQTTSAHPAPPAERRRATRSSRAD